MVQFLVVTSSDGIDHTRFEIDHDRSWNVLASSSFVEEDGAVVLDIVVLVSGTIRLDSVLEAVQFPACVTNLDTGLTNVE
ncbi:hypothetical protein D3C80_1521850 [compost metagenome]